MKSGALSATDRMYASILPGADVKSRISNSSDQSLFWSVVQETARDALKDALGEIILGVLTGQKMLENPEQAMEFTDRLTKVFGASGAKTLEFIITKDLYRRLGLSFNPDGSFNYETLLERAKNEFLARREISQ